MSTRALTVVGTGIHAGQLTAEAAAYIQGADRVLYLVADPITEEWIVGHNPHCYSLKSCYHESEDRSLAYDRMVSEILDALDQVDSVCVAFYGHPGVFVTPSFDVLRRARQAGCRAVMLPAVSADACLFADLEFDPSSPGYQSFEASAMLNRGLTCDPRLHVAVWQVGVIGIPDFVQVYDPGPGLARLQMRLTDYYPGSHMVCVYEASRFEGAAYVANWYPLDSLTQASVTTISTIYIPPIQGAEPGVE